MTEMNLHRMDIQFVLKNPQLIYTCYVNTSAASINEEGHTPLKLTPELLNKIIDTDIRWALKPYQGHSYFLGDFEINYLKQMLDSGKSYQIIII